MRYDRVTRLIHIGMAATVVLQLADSEFMAHPRPNPEHARTALQAGMYEVHEWAGIAALTLVVLRILWGFVGPEKLGWARLFPWRSGEGRTAMMRQIREEIPGWFKGKISIADDNPLAGSIHGFGLLTALGMGATGLLIFLGMSEDGHVNAFTHTVMEFHADVVANLMWAYVIGHVGMAMLHKLLGHDLVREMFSLKK